MAYLSADEYTLFGLEETTPDSLVIAASDLIDAHCRRKGFGIAQYMERFRVGRSRTVRLSYLPLAAAAGAASPIVQARGRYTGSAGEWAAVRRAGGRGGGGVYRAQYVVQRAGRFTGSGSGERRGDRVLRIAGSGVAAIWN